jgi:hypothetical protein
VGSACGSELICQRKPLSAHPLDGQLVAKREGVNLRDHRVQQAGHGRDQDERADEHAGIEMQS